MRGLMRLDIPISLAFFTLKHMAEPQNRLQRKFYNASPTVIHEVRRRHRQITDHDHSMVVEVVICHPLRRPSDPFTKSPSLTDAES